MLSLAKAHYFLLTKIPAVNTLVSLNDINLSQKIPFGGQNYSKGL